MRWWPFKRRKSAPELDAQTLTYPGYYRVAPDPLFGAPAPEEPPADHVATLTDALADKVGLLDPKSDTLKSFFFVGSLKTAEGWKLYQRLPDGSLSVVRHYTRRSNAQAAADRLNGHD